MQSEHFLFQAHHIWEGIHPVAFQMFHNTFWDKKPPSISADIGTPVFQKELESFYELFLSLNNVSLLTYLSRTVVQPFVEGIYACTIVLLVNIAQPEWIAVNCSTMYLTCAMQRQWVHSFSHTNLCWVWKTGVLSWSSCEQGQVLQLHLVWQQILFQVTPKHSLYPEEIEWNT